MEDLALDSTIATAAAAVTATGLFWIWGCAGLCSEVSGFSSGVSGFSSGVLGCGSGVSACGSRACYSHRYCSRCHYHYRYRCRYRYRDALALGLGGL